MSRLVLIVATWALGAMLAGAMSGCRRPPEPVSDPMTDAIRAGTDSSLSRAALEGRRLFLDRCATCHGDEGRGDGQNASRLSPRPRDLQSSLGALAADDLRRIVESGTAAVGRSPLCPPHARDLGPEGVDAVLLHLRAIAGGTSARPSPAAEALQH